MPRNIVSAKKEKAVKYKVTLVSRGVYWGRRALFRGKVGGFFFTGASLNSVDFGHGVSFECR